MFETYQNDFIVLKLKKKAISETTARKKDAAVNRFTRHEVKNGLLAAIGLCDNLKEYYHVDSDTKEQQVLLELDKTLHEILDTVLAEAMARDVIHEVYEHKHERVNIAQLIQNTSNNTAESIARFPIVTEPSPLPDMELDPQLLKYIHRNATSNACKYGKRGGTVLTEIKWDKEKGMLYMNVSNLPGTKHEEILKLGKLASKIIFSPARRLTIHSASNTATASHSSGDGAWVMHKCAKTLGGDCDIKFFEDKTIFTFYCPVTASNDIKSNNPNHHEEFKLPPNIYAIALDDSKIQRKILARYFAYAGIVEDRIRILGDTTKEIKCFVDWAYDFIVDHPDDYFLFIIDENLDVQEEQIAGTREDTVSGSLCVSKIRHKLLPDQESRLLALIRSANDSSDDVAIYNSRAHGYLPKAPIKPANVIKEVASVWLARFSPIEVGMKQVSANISIQHEFSDTTEELATTARDLVDIVTSIGRIISDEEAISNNWPVIFEKLHVLKGDLLTLSHENNQDLSPVIDMVDEMRVSTIPHNLSEKWELMRSKINAAR